MLIFLKILIQKRIPILVFNADQKIALLMHPTEGYGLLPGGGIEEGETEEDAFVRECKEELGCDVDIISKIGTAVQYRSKDSRRYEIHFFAAQVNGEIGVPTTTQEDELSSVITWLSKEDILKQLQEQVLFKSNEWYQRQFNSRTHLAAIEKYLRAQK